MADQREAESSTEAASIDSDPALAALLDGIAEKAKRLKLEAPLTFFLEAHLPFTTLFHTAGLLFQPVASPLFGAELIDRLQRLFAERHNVEELMRRLEPESRRE